MKSNYLKKIKRMILLGLVLSLCLASTVTVANAASVDDDNLVNNISPELIYETDEGIYTFSSVDEKNAIIALLSQEKDGVSLTSDVQTTSTETSRKKTTNGWIGFVSDFWGYHKDFHYSVGQTYTATLSGSYKGVEFTVSASKTYTVGGTLVADETRLSRLGLWQTYTVINYHAVTTGGYGSYIIDEFDYSYTSKSDSPIINAAYKTAPHKYGEPFEE